jgi:hypothetical protein
MIWHLLGTKKRPLTHRSGRSQINSSRITALWQQEAGLTFSRRQQWTEEEVSALPAGEHDYFDRKSGALFDDVTERNNLYNVLAKSGSAFVNSGGGHLVLGVGDDGTFDGVPAMLSGRTSTREWLEQILPDLFDYRLNDFRVHNVIRSEPSKIPMGRELIVIDFGDSALAPHQSRRHTTYFYRAGGHSVSTPHFYLELLRQRLTNASLEFELDQANIEVAWEYEGALYLRIVVSFWIENTGRIAAYKWRLALRAFDASPERTHDFFFNGLPGAPGRNSRIRIDDTILPGCKEREKIIFGVRISSSARRSEEAIRNDLVQLFTGLRLHLQLATETSPGQLKVVEVGPAIPVEAALPLLRSYI